MSEAEVTLNIGVFKKISNEHFMEGLEHAPTMLKSSQASLFYKTVLKHFSKDDVSQEVGDAILQSIAKCICNDDNMRCFIDGSYAEQLPFKNQKFQDSIFDILYVIITSNPKLLDESISNKMHYLIRSNPKKSLTLIALYGQRFNEIDNPWPMIDLLIKDAKYFYNVEVASDYVSLLSFLNKKFIEYRSGRAVHCWNQIKGMIIGMTDKNILKQCYGGLCALSEGCQGASLPLTPITEHLRDPALQDCVLAVLNMSTLNESDASSKQLISTLLSVAETNVKATLVLMKLACDLAPTQTIMAIAGWEQKKLPTTLDTLRLFLVCLRHVEFRQFICESPDFVEFLKCVLTLRKSGLSPAPIACTIIRRVPLSEELVTNLSKSGFLSQFYNTKEDDDGYTQHSKLLLTDTICRVKYVSDFLVMCDKIAHIIMDEGDFATDASLVSLKLCAYKNCRERMKELKLDSFFRKKRNDDKFKANSKKFLQAINEQD